MVALPENLIGTSKKVISELSIPNYQIARAKYNQVDDELDVFLVSYFDHMPDITLSVKKYKGYVNAIVRVSISDNTYYMSPSARILAESLSNAIYTELTGRLKEEHHEKFNEEDDEYWAKYYHSII